MISPQNSFEKYQTYIDVQPDAVLLADVRDGLDGVECAEDRRAGRAVHEEREVALTLVTDDQLLKLFGDHSSAAVIRSV